MSLKLGEHLVATSRLSQDAVDAGITAQQGDDRRLGAILVEQGLDIAELRSALGEVHGVAPFSPGITPQPDLLAPPVARTWGAIPLKIVGDKLHVAMVDPSSEVARAEVAAASGFTTLDVTVIAQDDFNALARELLGGELDRGTAADLWPTARGRGASELHLEPSACESRVRARIGGALVTLGAVERRGHAGSVAQLVAMGAQTLTTVHGERAVLRHAEAPHHQLVDLGFPSKVAGRLKRLVDVPQGLVLVTGPRDSGRSTISAALVRQAAGLHRQVVVLSATDPGIPGAARVQPGDAAQIQDIMRQDPDVVLIDGPADPATLAAAATGALEGRLVVLSAPGGRAVDACINAISAGVDAWLLAATLRASIGVRLVRTVCASCAAAHEPTPAELSEFGVQGARADQATYKLGRGCSGCDGSGYAGRAMLAETLFASSDLQAALRDGATAQSLTELGRTDGFHTLWEDGIVRVLRGETTFEELRTALIPPS